MTETPTPVCDAYGIIIEDYISRLGLAYCRVADDTHPTLVGALALAAEALADGAERVSVITCRWGQRAFRWSPVEDASLVTLTAHADLLVTLTAHADLTDH